MSPDLFGFSRIGIAEAKLQRICVDQKCTLMDNETEISFRTNRG